MEVDMFHWIRSPALGLSQLSSASSACAPKSTSRTSWVNRCSQNPRNNILPRESKLWISNERRHFELKLIPHVGVTQLASSSACALKPISWTSWVTRCSQNPRINSLPQQKKNEFQTMINILNWNRFRRVGVTPTFLHQLHMRAAAEEYYSVFKEVSWNYLVFSINLNWFSKAVKDFCDVWWCPLCFFDFLWIYQDL